MRKRVRGRGQIKGKKTTNKEEERKGGKKKKGWGAETHTLIYMLT